MNLELLAKDLGESVSRKLSPIRKAIGQIADSIINLDARIKELEARETTVSRDDVLSAVKSDDHLLREIVADYLKENPPKDGRDADPVEITHDDILTALKSDTGLLRDVVSDYLKDNPPPAGKDADPVTQNDIVSAIKEHPQALTSAVADYLKEHPPEAGKDGIGATGAMIDKSGELIITLGNGTLERVGKVVGKDGADLSDISFEYDGERTISVKAKGGEVVSKYRIPIPIDKGYWRKGDVCEVGDCVTRDGCLWVSLKDNNKTEPSTQNKEYWRLGVRKGRDGKTTTVVNNSAVKVSNAD